MIAPAQRLSVLLLVGIAALAAAASFPFLPPAGVPERPAQAAAPAAAPSRILPPPLAPLSGFAETAARPLFAESRRPAAVAAQAAPARHALRLDGLIVIGTRKEAILKDTGENRSYRLGEGGTAAGWTVRRIERDRVELVSPEGEMVLTPGRPPK